MIYNEYLNLPVLSRFIYLNILYSCNTILDIDILQITMNNIHLTICFILNLLYCFLTMS